MKKRNLLAILITVVLIASSASVYAIQVQKTITVEKDKTEPLLQDGNFIAKIGLEKNEEALYDLNGIWENDKKLISCEGTVTSGEKEGTFTGIFKADKKSYFEITMIIDEEKIFFCGGFKFDKNKEDFQGLWSNKGEEKCFEFIYPISYMMPDGSIITGNSEKEIMQLIKEWYTAHPGEKEKPQLQYPADIKYKDGTIVTINSDEELKEAYENCDDKEWGWISGTFQDLDKGKPKTKNHARFSKLANLLKMFIYRFFKK